MEFIVVVDRNMAIGCDGGLLFHVPEDLAFFKRTTMGHPLVLGRKTLESFPGGKALPGRKNLVLTRDPNYEVEGGKTLTSYKELARYLREHPDEEPFLLGGASLYHELLPYCRGGYITFLEAEADKADVHFPDLRQDENWEDQGLVNKSSEDSDIAFQVHYFKHKVPRQLEVDYG